MSARALALFVSLALTLSFPSIACGTVQRAAREDPMRCERDPKCDKKRSGAQDCSRQCNDDPACMDRCEQVQAPNKLGH